MKYIIKNIRNFIHEERMIFILLCLSIIASVLVLHIAYGIYNAVNKDMIDALYGSSDLMIDFSGSSSNPVTKDELLDAIDVMDTEIVEGLDGIVVSGWFPADDHIIENEFNFNFRYVDGKITCVNEIYDNMVDSDLWLSGSYFTSRQYEQGELVAVAGCGELRADKDITISEITPDDIVWPVNYPYQPRNGKLMVGGKEYMCIGQQMATYTPMIPFTTVDGKFVVNWIDFVSEGVMKRREYEAIAGVLSEYFPNIEIPPYPVPDADETMIYKSIMAICVMIVIISAIVYVVLYQYIIERRKRTLDIFRVTGLSLINAGLIYMGECLVLIITCYGAALVLFESVILPVLNNIYYYLDEVFTVQIYGKLCMIYFAIVFGILMIKLIHSFNRASMTAHI